jgi:hypothetical protein
MLEAYVPLSPRSTSYLRYLLCINDSCRLPRVLRGILLTKARCVYTLDLRYVPTSWIDDKRKDDLRDRFRSLYSL